MKREKIDQKIELSPLKLGTTRFDVLFKRESYEKIVQVLPEGKSYFVAE